MKRPLRWAFAAVLVVGAGLAILWALLRGTNGFSAREEPPAFEKNVARRLRRLSQPARVREAKNPVAATPVALARARAYFADHCAVCHANDGRGRTELGQHMYPRVPDMAGLETQALTDGEIFHAIRYGIRLTGMPAWGGDDPASDEEAWTLVHLIRHLPRLTAQEQEEIRRLAPKTPEEWQVADEERRLLEAEGGRNRFAPLAPQARPSP
jgi:mono/diheme cytochrome c family protein